MRALYDGNGGEKQRTSIKNTQIGWMDIKMDSQLHIIEGVSQFEYLESLGAKLIREARQALDTFLDKWNRGDATNPKYEEAVKREAARKLWRAWYNKYST